MTLHQEMIENVSHEGKQAEVKKFWMTIIMHEVDKVKYSLRS